MKKRKSFSQLPDFDKNKFKQTLRTVVVVGSTDNGDIVIGHLMDVNGNYLYDILNNKLIAKE